MRDTIVKLFWSGRSQAVRLPKAYRFEADQVRIRRHGVALILEPVADDWAWLDHLAKVDDDFASLALEQPEAPLRNEAGTVFE